MYQRIISVISNRYLLATILTLVLIGVLPYYFSKYHLELVDTELNKDSRIYYQDLNNDGLSEKIQYYHNSIDRACYMIFASNNDLIDQFNFRGVIPNLSSKTLWFLDLNGNGLNEIYNITQRMDSVFLNVQEPFIENGLNQKDIFIDKVSPYDNSYKVVVSSEAFKIRDNEENGIVFSLNTGFAANPRHVYSYNPYSRKVIKSDHLVNVSVPVTIQDINADGVQEVILRNHASDNYIDTIFTKRSDKSTWLSVLTSDLDFLFKPIEFQIKAGLHVLPLKQKQDIKLLVCLNSKRKGERADTFFVFDDKGNKERELEIEPIDIGNLFIDDKNERIIRSDRQKGLIYIYDYSLDKISTKELSYSGNLYQIKLKHFSEMLWIQYNLNQKQIVLYQSNFQYPVVAKIPFELNKPLIGAKENIDMSQIHIWQNGKSYLLEYKENPLFAMQLGIYILLYLGMLLLVCLIQQGQHIRLEKQRAIEIEIAELQLKTMKNQVDPHFVFNAINTISEMTLMDNKLEADALISRFSGFMRDTLRHSDKITTTLQEELNYVENFINLQRLRLNNSFDYEIVVAEAVDTTFKVPKHVLFTYVENAIKHSLAIMDYGFLKIEAKLKNTELQLIIEDNGSGFKAGNSNVKGTGNGLKIMDKIFALYTKRYNRKINRTLMDLSEISNKSGFRVEILISL